jgi:hypothetical protein
VRQGLGHESAQRGSGRSSRHAEKGLISLCCVVCDVDRCWTKAVEELLKPSWVEVERVAEKGEGALFEDKFFKWSDSMRAVIGKVSHKTLSNVAIR